MVIKLNAISRWSTLAPGEAINFEKSSDGQARRVRLHLNLQAETVLNLEDADGPRFLVTAPAGTDTLEFTAGGQFVVFPDEGSGVVQYQTAEAEPTCKKLVDPVIFTKLANRRHRNPELEEVMHRMQANLERRLTQQSAEFEAAMMRTRKEPDVKPTEAKPDPVAAAPSVDSAKVPEPKPAEPKPASDPASGATGEVKPGSTPSPANG